jgi:hypothetical protein
VQALDHATGYLMAATVVRALTRRLDDGHGTAAQLSLARTAKLLTDGGDDGRSSDLASETPADLAPGTEDSDWGKARRLAPPVTVAGSAMRWQSPARQLGSAPAAWRQ